MSDEQQEYSALPQYLNPPPAGTRMADAKEQKPLMKMMNKMMKPKTARVMKISQKMPKKKHTVHFY